MALTYDERVELLKKARQAKAEKKLAKAKEIQIVAEPEPEPLTSPAEAPVAPVKKTRSKSVAPKKTLDIKPAPMPAFVDDSDPEIIEEVIYKPKDKKKKKKIIRKVIMEQSSSDEEVEIVEEIKKKPKAKKEIVAQAQPQPPVAQPPVAQPAVAPVPVPPKNPFFNF